MNKPLENKTLLVVDDDPDTCELLRFNLEQAGATVVVEHSAEGVLETYRESPPDAVVADIRLGSSDGYSLIQAIRKIDVEYRGFTPALAVTGFSSPEDKERALAAGFNAYMTKPFDCPTLIETIAQLLTGTHNQAA